MDWLFWKPGWMPTASARSVRPVVLYNTPIIKHNRPNVCEGRKLETVIYVTFSGRASGPERGNGPGDERTRLTYTLKNDDVNRHIVVLIKHSSGVGPASLRRMLCRRSVNGAHTVNLTICNGKCSMFNSIMWMWRYARRIGES